MKKILTLGFALVFALPLVACNKENVVLEEAKTYEITSDIHSLDIRINAADFTVKDAEFFSIESNLKYLSVSEKNGVLTIVDEARKTSNYSNATLTVYVPKDTLFEDVNITTGAAKLTVDTLSANTVELELGAGDVRFERLNASSEIEIEGGAGQITIVSGTLYDLSLEMGMGELNLAAAIFGNSELEFGIGESNLTLIGIQEDYKIDIEKGIGNITVDGKTVSDFVSSGNGQNHIEIKGGVGTINLKFQTS